MYFVKEKANNSYQANNGFNFIERGTVFGLSFLFVSFFFFSLSLSSLLFLFVCLGGGWEDVI